MHYAAMRPIHFEPFIHFIPQSAARPAIIHRYYSFPFRFRRVPSSPLASSLGIFVLFLPFGAAAAAVAAHE